MSKKTDVGISEVGLIPREKLKKAMMQDFLQHMINSYTPDRGYPFPIDNVEALISKYRKNLK